MMTIPQRPTVIADSLFISSDADEPEEADALSTKTSCWMLVGQCLETVPDMKLLKRFCPHSRSCETARFAPTLSCKWSCPRRLSSSVLEAESHISNAVTSHASLLPRAFISGFLLPRSQCFWDISSQIRISLCMDNIKAETTGDASRRR